MGLIISTVYEELSPRTKDDVDSWLNWKENGRVVRATHEVFSFIPKKVDSKWKFVTTKTEILKEMEYSSYEDSVCPAFIYTDTRLVRST